MVMGSASPEGASLYILIELGCLSVCLFVRKLLLGKCITIDILYIIRSGIVLGRYISETKKIRPTVRPQSSENVRNHVTYGTKIAVFSRFFVKLTGLSR